jgi:NAD(P)-dependent dehydrogenase (short-subunit alcohol dehydrogenase family)
MAKELAGKSIRVNTVMPGWVKTDMYAEYMSEHGNAPDAGMILARQYMGITETEDIANAIAYLLCDSTKTITGSSLRIDGGFLT